MKWDWKLTPPAEKDLTRIDRPIRARILDALDQLALELSADTPYPANTKKLTGMGDEWRLRVGDYRVRFKKATLVVESGELEGVIVVTHSRHRREAYRD